MSVAKKRKKPRLRKLNPKRLGICALILCALLLGVKIGHYFGDEKTRDAIEGGVVFFVDAGRECSLLPDEARVLLDGLAHLFPLVHGNFVDAGTAADTSALVIGGVPASAQNLRLLKNTGYLSGYDDTAGNPAWVAYKVFEPKSFETGTRPAFETDLRTRARVSPEDYTHSRFDRGHMAPNQAMGACYGEVGQRESFLMSNIVPQLHEVNAGLWKDLEQRILKRFTRSLGEIRVLCGPIYDAPATTKKLRGKVAVPDAFFLVVVDCDESRGNALHTLAFIIPHQKNLSNDARKYLVSIREIERRTGLNFFPQLEPAVQDALETVPAKAVW